MCSEFDIPQKRVLLTTLPNLNDLKNRQIYEIRLGVPAEFAETPPPIKCHLSIKATTSTRHYVSEPSAANSTASSAASSATSSAANSAASSAANSDNWLTVDCSSSSGSVC